jgi:ubiquinone/menaquinone biosynthesis C-methylase UbiE
MNREAESEQLRAAWLRHPADFLDSYLVHGIENPCLNPQSVLMRGLLASAIAPQHCSDLIEQEKLYSACVCLTLKAFADQQFDAFTAALENEPGADDRYALPAFLKNLRDNPKGLPFTLRGIWQQVFQAAISPNFEFTSPFENLWRERLANLNLKPATLLETGCGSANDYRYFAKYGLDRLVEYTGVDICSTNVANAQRRCPGGKFVEGNAWSLPVADQSFDFYWAFDLFEHLSIEGMELALGEAARVTRQTMWLSFFQLDWSPGHEVVFAPPYHRNILSAPRLIDTLSRHGFAAKVIDLPADWAEQFPGYRHYNSRGRIIEARRQPDREL